MRLIINDGVAQRPPVPFSGLLDRFLLDQKQEQESEQITHNTLASYRSMISQHIRPKWGDCKSWGKFVPLWFRIGSESWPCHQSTKAISVL
jgi:hypothetical protein